MMDIIEASMKASIGTNIEVIIKAFIETTLKASIEASIKASIEAGIIGQLWFNPFNRLSTIKSMREYNQLSGISCTVLLIFTVFCSNNQSR